MNCNGVSLQVVTSAISKSANTAAQIEHARRISLWTIKSLFDIYCRGNTQAFLAGKSSSPPRRGQTLMEMASCLKDKRIDPSKFLSVVRTLDIVEIICGDYTGVDSVLDATSMWCSIRSIASERHKHVNEQSGQRANHWYLGNSIAAGEGSTQEASASPNKHNM
jgi:hypothetical protein